MSGEKTRDLAIILGAGLVLCLLAARFDFVCDDAFIALRYARNLALHGQPVYNLGERVEGYTSFSWMVLVAAGTWAGAPTVGFTQVLGAVSGIGILAAALALWRRSVPAQPLVTTVIGALVLGALALSAPVEAWTMGGLETPLFAALVTWSFACAIELLQTPSRRHALHLGVALGLATLTRPEGALVSVALGLPLGWSMLRARKLGTFMEMVACVALIVGAHTLWRYSYYGYPLPNTFYVKSSGDTGLLRARGGQYLLLAARELGVVFVGVLAASLLFGTIGTRNSEATHAGRQLTFWTARILIPIYALYLVAVGGDFLDLYRFLVPLLPLAFVVIGAALVHAFGKLANGGVVLALAVVMVALFGVQQHTLAERAQQVAEPERAKHGIEPQGWTRLYALRWAAIGRWIALHSKPGDGMAVGAAGAMPYYAGIDNLDTFGLCDAWVAHHAPIVGHRPGHQRFAPESYILSKHPVFLLIGSDYSSDTPKPLRIDARWERKGYVWAEARIDQKRFGAPTTFFHYLLMRSDRAQQSSDWLRIH